MNTVMSATARAHRIGRESPVRQAHRGLVFWHHDEPRLHLARLDPAHALLRTHFPHSWRHLVRVRALLDAAAVLDLPAAMLPDEQHFEQAAPLLRAAARELSEVAEKEQNTSARLAADRLTAYTGSGRWQPAGAEPAGVGTDGPWVHVGPAPALSGTVGEDLPAEPGRVPLCLLVAAPHGELQAEADALAARTDDLRGAAGEVLGEAVVDLAEGDPGIAVADLLLAGGVTPSGHGDLTPLPSGPVALFANVRRHRLRRAFASTPERSADDLDASVRRSLRRSVAHLAAHRWRRASLPGAGASASGLKGFEYAAFEEAYAVLLGTLAVAGAAGTSDALCDFVDELTPYTELPRQEAADTAAALLVIGRLRQSHSAWSRPLTLESVAAARPALHSLVGSVHAALWEADVFALAEVRAAFAAGVRHRARVVAQESQPPEELGWTFG